MSDSSRSSEFCSQGNVQNVDKKTIIKEVIELKESGDGLFLIGNYDLALMYYTVAISVCPRTEELTLSILFQNRASTYKKMNNNTNSLADCDMALALVPSYKKALLRRSKVLTELGNFKLALEDISALLILEKSKNRRLLMFKEILNDCLAEQNVEEYTKHNALSLPSKIVINYYLESFCDDIFSDEFTLALLKSDIDTGLEYALKCIQHQKYEEIENACQEELNKTHNSLIRRSLTLNLLATFCHIRGNYVASIEHLTTVIENPNVPNKLIINSLVKRATDYYCQEEKDKSLEDFKHAEAINPNSSLVYYQRAQTCFDEYKNTEEPVEDYKKAVELNPEFVLAVVNCYYAQFCHAYRASNELDIKKFLRKLKECVIKYPDIYDSHKLYAKALMKTQHYEEADSVYKKACEIHPENVIFPINRALCSLSHETSIPDALILIEQTLNIDPTPDFVYETLGELNRDMGNFKKAIYWLEKAVPLCRLEKQLFRIFSMRNLARAKLAAYERLDLTPPKRIKLDQIPCSDEDEDDEEEDEEEEDEEEDDDEEDEEEDEEEDD